jgi:7-carboxy-7-deazaguanine synthase
MGGPARSDLQSARRLKITEVFLSIQGEAGEVGWPTVFVRLTGCPLRCVYCDTAYAFHGGRWMTFDELLAEVSSLDTRRVCVTGGEPLAQRNCLEFLTRLCDEGYRVSLETSGALDVSDVDPRVVKVMDLKTPGSGESHRNRMDNLGSLGPEDVLKFVISDRADYEWARSLVSGGAIPAGREIFFSPSWGQLDARELAEWVLSDRLPVRVQIQLHKILWGEEPGR